MSTTRINKVSIIVGGRGKGKTDFTKNLIYPLKKKRIILDTLDSPPWRNYKTFNHPEREKDIIPIAPLEKISDPDKGTIRIINSNTEEVFEAIADHAWNSLVVIEDATRFISRQVDQNVKKFVLDTKQKNLDLIFVFHSLVDVPPDLIRWSDYLTLFVTNERWNSYLRNKFPNQQIEAAFDKVRTLPAFQSITIPIGA